MFRVGDLGLRVPENSIDRVALVIKRVSAFKDDHAAIVKRTMLLLA